MAENKIVITTEVNTAPAVNSLKQLKAELKAAQAAALNGDGKAAQRVAELKDKLDDLKDATKTLQGSGVEKVSSSFNLLGDGLKNFDFDKIKTGFKGIGSAMAAIPVLLIVEGITYLVQNFDELSKGGGILAKSLRAVGDVIDLIKDGIYALTDAIGLTNSALDAMGEAATSNAERAKEALSDQNAEYERQAAVAKAAGKSTIEIEKQKQQSIIDTNKQIINQILAFKKAGGELSDEQYKLLKSSTEAIKNAQTQLTVIGLESEAQRTEKIKEQYEKQKEAARKKYEEQERLRKEQAEREEKARLEELARQTDAEEYLKAQDALNAAKLERQKQSDAERLAYSAELAEIEMEQKKRLADEEIRLNREMQSARLEAAANTTKAIQGISDLAFTIRMANVKKGSAEEEKIAKRQFQINKGIQISQAAISGAQGILNALTAKSVIPEPAATAFRIANVAAVAATTAATIAKISAAKFEGAGGGGDTSSPSISTPNVSAGGGETNAPTTAAPPQAPTTGLDEQGNVIGRSGVVKAVVVETDITGSQDRIKRYNNESSF